MTSASLLFPKVMNYVDHLVLVTGRSTRHITALAEYVRWLVSECLNVGLCQQRIPTHRFVARKLRLVKLSLIMA